MRSIGLAVPGFLLHLAGFVFGVIPIGLLIYGGPRDNSPAPLSYVFGALVIVLATASGYFGSRAPYQKHGLRAWEGFGFLAAILSVIYQAGRVYGINPIHDQLRLGQWNFSWMPDTRIVTLSFIAPIIGSFWMLRRESRLPIVSLKPENILNGTWKGVLSSHFAILSVLLVALPLQDGISYAAREIIDTIYGTGNLTSPGSIPSSDSLRNSHYAGQFVPFFSGIIGSWVMWIFAGRQGFVVLVTYRLLLSIIPYSLLRLRFFNDLETMPEFRQLLIKDSIIYFFATFGGLLLGAWIAASSLRKLNVQKSLKDQPLP
jgi:hypothetical protein